MNSKDLTKEQIKIWVAIAKDNTIQMFTKIPKRGKNSWIGECYINSAIYKSITNIIKNSTLSWSSEPEYLELAYVAQQ